LLHVPAGLRPERPAPLVVAFHGAGGEGRQMLDILTGLADAEGFLLLAPDSRGVTWDVILDGYGPDVAFVDEAMGRVFAGHAVDPARLAAAGFSDGASYALSLGLTNGGLFTHVLAFSPGFMAPARPRTARASSSATACATRSCRSTAPAAGSCRAWRRPGYEVEYREFPDGHTVPARGRAGRGAWFLGG
jgi:phospholipase/carboxylesterase